MQSRAEVDPRKPLSRSQVSSHDRNTDVRAKPDAEDEVGTAPPFPGDYDHGDEDDASLAGTDQHAPAVAEWEAPPGRMSGEHPRREGMNEEGEYLTGSEYPVGDLPEDQREDDETGSARHEREEDEEEEDPDAPLDDLLVDDPDGAPPRDGDEDIYGEDDYPEEDESYQGLDEDEDASRAQKSRTATRAKGRGKTRIAPVDEPEEEEQGDRTRAGPPFRLEIVLGPDQGKTKRFRGVRMVVGRVPGCDLKLSDQSVSRRHLEMIQGEKGVMLRDLGSGNGTKINGQKVSEQLLQDGDEIAIGKTKFKFVDELAQYRKAREAQEKQELEELAKAAAAAERAEQLAKEAEAAANPQPAPEASAPDAASSRIHEEGADFAGLLRRGRKMRERFGALSRNQKLGAAIAAAGTLLAVLITVFIATRESKDPQLEAAEVQLAAARAALDADQLETAINLAQRATQLFATADREGLGDRARRELGAEKALEAARKLTDEGKFLEAEAELKSIVNVGPKRTARANALRVEVNAKHDDYLYAKAKEALANKDAESAAQIIPGLTPSRSQELSNQLVELKVKLEGDRRYRETQRVKSVEQGKKRQEQARAAELDTAFQGVARKFHAGEFSRATLECDRVTEQFRDDADIRARSTELKKLIPTFARNFEDGQRKFKAGALESSVRPLRRAKEIYKDIGFTGALGTLIDEELASAALAAAKAAHARADYPSAAAGYRETLKLNPSEERAKEGLARLLETADELYGKGYQVRDSDPRAAIVNFKIILEIAPADAAVYHKAKEALASMQP